MLFPDASLHFATCLVQQLVKQLVSLMPYNLLLPYLGVKFAVYVFETPKHQQVVLFPLFPL